MKCLDALCGLVVFGDIELLAYAGGYLQCRQLIMAYSVVSGVWQGAPPVKTCQAFALKVERCFIPIVLIKMLFKSLKEPLAPYLKTKELLHLNI